MTHSLQFALLIALCCVLHRIWEPRHPLLKLDVVELVMLLISDMLNSRCLDKLLGLEISVNDPSAGSPTETLLRLHLPLNDEV